MDKCPTTRPMALITLNNGLKIANVHLCGGRFDGANENSNIFAQKEIKLIIETHNPDIIAGDFNSEYDEKRWQRTATHIEDKKEKKKRGQ